MKLVVVLLLLQYIALLKAEEAETKDLIENSEDLERRHRKRKKGQNSGPCGGVYGSGKSFFGFHDTQPAPTYISAPVMNYFFNCGGAIPVAPIAPIAPVGPVAHLPALPYPVNIGVSQSQSSHNHGGGHGGYGGHGGGLFGGHGGGFARPGAFAGANNNYGAYNPGFNNYQYPYPQNFGQGGYNRPIQNVVSAAASGFGNALADYFTTRPRKTYKQINKQVNQLLRPFYKLF